ncbi:hypothetical protein OAJ14_08100 [Polaribacter sp.]|nr:hypothetical protein [Polaribacter sp.]
MSKLKDLNFFKSVAHHNLERFHSECISWAFNASEKMLLNFIKKVANPDDILDITDAEVHCERHNTDILVSYKMGDTHHFIHIENKIKANEHFIAVNPKKVEKEYNGIAKNTKLSQTQFYLIRNKAEIEQEFNAGEKVKWQYLFLVPAVSDEKQKNMWDDTREEKNLWVTISYWHIVTSMPVSTGNKIFDDYRDFLVSQFLGENQRTPCQVIIKNESISKNHINECLKPQTTILRKYGLRLHFEAVAEELRNFVRNEYPNEPFEVRFLTDTGNNGGFLLEVFTTASLQNPNPKIFNSKKPIDFRIGFQFEQNKPDKGKFKFYFADVVYKSGLIKETGKEEYHNAVGGTKDSIGILRTIFGEETLDKCRDKNNKLKFNKSTSKSFCSYLINNFSFRNKTNLESIFKSEIKTLVNSLSQHNFKDLLNDKLKNNN